MASPLCVPFPEITLMNSVYLLMRGENGENGLVLGVYSSLDRAREAANNAPPYFPEGWKEVNQNYWENGCDWLDITEWEVD